MEGEEYDVNKDWNIEKWLFEKVFVLLKQSKNERKLMTTNY